MVTSNFLPSWCVKSATAGSLGRVGWETGLTGAWVGDAGGEKKAKMGERSMIRDFLGDFFYYRCRVLGEGEICV